MTAGLAGTATGRFAVQEIRRARRRRRLAKVDFFEALYRAYIAAIIAVIAVIALSGLTGDAAVAHGALGEVRAHGAAVVGAAAALGVAIALRSAGRGGPLALEAADVRHLLTAPVERRYVLRGPALQQLRFGAFAAGALGGVVGIVAYRRLPGTPVAWVAALAATGAVAALGALGAGQAASGRRLGRSWRLLATLAVLGWSAADLVLGTRTSPFTLLGELALWPLHVDPMALVGVALSLGLAGAGLVSVGGVSIEAAERRSELVGTLRFAATARDLRTVMVLRRQLAQERPRRRPWLPIARRPGRGAPALAVWKRGWQGVLRWPARRLARLLVLGGIAGLAMRAMWAGTTPLLALGATAMWAAALDAVEPLSQELDHLDRLGSYPHAEGWVQVRHLLVPTVLMLGVAACGGAVASALGGGRLAWQLTGMTALPAAASAVAGAAVSVARGFADPSMEMMAPDLTGVRIVVRELIPPVIAGIGLLPVLAARSAARHHQLVLDAAVNPAVFCLAAPLAVAGWLSRRPQRLAGPAPERVGQR